MSSINGDLKLRTEAVQRQVLLVPFLADAVVEVAIVRLAVGGLFYCVRDDIVRLRHNVAL